MISLWQDFGLGRLRRGEDRMGECNGCGSKRMYENRMPEVLAVLRKEGEVLISEADRYQKIIRTSHIDINTGDYLQGMEKYYIITSDTSSIRGIE